MVSSYSTETNGDSSEKMRCSDDIVVCLGLFVGLSFKKLKLCLLPMFILLICWFVIYDGTVGFGQQAAPNCDTVYGVEIGDTCFSVTQKFNLTTEFFTEINPNLVCDKAWDSMLLAFASHGIIQL
ncbi:hypothetical protein HYC85_012139 [Camellia sinensis]|uniref:LysM domain-containing protein n=1 Tax=Camellia sinensis TaxID=4442 RepID=A0A7J7HEC3_CAMSI|nr:hypothetical protein HYC85_012139 [Camellia sinensis]